MAWSNHVNRHVHDAERQGDAEVDTADTEAEGPLGHDAEVARKGQNDAAGKGMAGERADDGFWEVVERFVEVDKLSPEREHAIADIVENLAHIEADRKVTGLRTGEHDGANAGCISCIAQGRDQ